MYMLCKLDPEYTCRQLLENEKVLVDCSSDVIFEILARRESAIVVVGRILQGDEVIFTAIPLERKAR